MIRVVLLLSSLVFHQVLGAEIKAASDTGTETGEQTEKAMSRVEGKSLGVPFFGGYGGVGHGHLQPVIYPATYLHRPISLPILNKDGCRFPGDVVCNPNEDPVSGLGPTNSYCLCILANESKNLWKKPSLTVAPAIPCVMGTNVLDEFCNNNDRLLTHAGLRKSREEAFLANFHHRKYAYSINPCIVAP